MSPGDNLANRAKRAYSDQRIKDEAKKRADDERKAEEEEKRIQDLQNSPSGRGAQEAAKRWFRNMRVRAVATVVTDQTYGESERYDNPAWGSGGYVPDYTWTITTVTWELEGHHYRGHYTDFGDRSKFNVLVKIVRQNDTEAWLSADTLAQLGHALGQEES